MKPPKDITNDDLALHIEFWYSVNDQLTERQKSYFEETVWRLRMMVDHSKEKENLENG